MAFVNAELTDEEKIAYEKSGVSRYGSCFSRMDVPRRWTIDRERGIALVDYGIVDRDYPQMENFAFVNTDLEKKEVLFFITEKLCMSESEEKSLKELYGVDKVRKYRVSTRHSDISIINSASEFKELLLEAMTCYEARYSRYEDYSVKIIFV